LAELNELLEQAAAESGELTEDAGEASEAIKAVVGRADDLLEEVTSKGETARRHLQSLKDKLSELAAAVTSARGRADSSLETLGTRAVAVKAEVVKLLASVKAGLDELEAEKTRLQNDADTQTQAAQGEFVALSDHVGDLGDSLDQQLVTAHNTITAFRSGVETARMEFMAKKAEWDKAMVELEAQATEQSLNWADGLQELLSGQAKALVESTNHIVEAHNTAMDELKEKFAVEAKGAVAGSLQALRDELVKLGQNASDKQDDLTAKSDQILGKVREAIPVIEQITSVLEPAAERL
jgi:DNA repair exonuclease SbcCD ATPase subunit